MPDLGELQQRGVDLFGQLLDNETSTQAGFGLTDNMRRFSWFHPPDATLASGLTLQFSALAASKSDRDEGLEAVLDAAAEATDEPAGLVRQALSLFVTHNDAGRNLIKPRTVTGAKALFAPSAGADRPSGFPVSEGGEAPELDYWREDPLANEHHEHWHQVYPGQGIPVRDFARWVQETPLDDMVAVLDFLAPGNDWGPIVQAADPVEVANAFAGVVNSNDFFALPQHLQQIFLDANDRHGELFIYMHAQMLARYDAELASHGLDRVQAWGPTAWNDPVPVGHNPIEIQGFGRRPVGLSLPGPWVTALEDLQSPVEAALASGLVQMQDGSSQPLDADSLGEMLEASQSWTTDIDAGRTATYQGLHNTGHGILASLSDPSGVMSVTTTAIRDPIFWRWHKHIDDTAARWHDVQPPTDFSDAPAVSMRNNTDATVDDAWTSPDLILVQTALLPDGDPVAAGIETFGGANWDLFLSEVTGPAAVAVTNELVTRFAERVGHDGTLVPYLTHDPFALYLRINNPSAGATDVTVRLFLVPEQFDEDRRAWIEMDKFRVTLDPGQNVLFRGDTDSSVIKRPAETDPDAVSSDASANESGYCDCGWPYTLLLPKGTDTGMGFRMVAICTDWALDQVAEPEACGSMSFCGAVDRYPDLRPMGYPFHAPFANTIAATFTGLDNAAGRSLTIRHDA